MDRTTVTKWAKVCLLVGCLGILLIFLSKYTILGISISLAASLVTFVLHLVVTLTSYTPEERQKARTELIILGVVMVVLLLMLLTKI